MSNGTSMMPAFAHAKNVITHIGEFGPHIRTRSPFFRPRD